MFIIAKYLNSNKSYIFSIILNVCIVFSTLFILFINMKSEFILINEITNSGKYENTYFLRSSRENKNYNYNTIYSEESDLANITLMKYIIENYKTRINLPEFSNEGNISFDSKSANYFYINEGFYKDFIFSYLDEDTGFSEGDFYNASQYINVILGSDYLNSYEVGQIVDEKYKVVGILNKDIDYYNLRYSSSKFSNSNDIYVPINLNEIDIIDRSLALDYLTIIEEDRGSVQYINNISEENNIPKWNFIEYKERLDEINQSRSGFYNYLKYFTIVSMITMLISTLCILKQKFKNMTETIELGYISKAINSNIKKLLIIEKIIMLIISCFFALLFEVYFMKLTDYNLLKYIVIIMVFIYLCIYLIEYKLLENYRRNL